ncbi:ParB/RepB/Spo0J family partition protein [Sphingorhabdus arenilitoris]|uniref:ParB/RepB/Spo0J family partition protein n=1 Tax=Sphingorhabdus arenilitoris TaxID=1490041 RepID=A0ABV8RDK0_9SPHN
MSDPKEKAVPRKLGLGRGLDALLGEAIREQPVVRDDGDASAVNSNSKARAVAAGIASINVADITPNPAQPRRHFAEPALEELAQSLSRHGIIQPIVVRPFGKGYQIVAGERRWRAAQKAQIHSIPAIVRDFDDAETLEIAIIENIQRQDLNPIEEAEAYKRLSDEFGHSQAALAQIVDKSRSHVANMMRLLDLPPTLRDLVIENKLQMGHARALLGSEQAVELAAVVVKKGLSVRATEALVRKNKSGSKAATTKPSMRDASADADIRAVENHLGDLLGLKVMIKQEGSSGAGAVTFQYGSLDQLDMLCQRLTGETF